jgi:hypothetical protein
VIVSVLVIVSYIVSLEMRRQPNAWSPNASNDVPQAHLAGDLIIGRFTPPSCQ